MTREQISNKIEALRKEMMTLEAHMSTMSSSQLDWACDRIDEIAAQIRDSELELTRV